MFSSAPHLMQQEFDHIWFTDHLKSKESNQVDILCYTLKHRQLNLLPLGWATLTNKYWNKFETLTSKLVHMGNSTLLMDRRDTAVTVHPCF